MFTVMIIIAFLLVICMLDDSTDNTNGKALKDLNDTILNRRNK